MTEANVVGRFKEVKKAFLEAGAPFHRLMREVWRRMEGARTEVYDDEGERPSPPPLEKRGTQPPQPPQPPQAPSGTALSLAVVVRHNHRKPPHPPQSNL